MAGSFRDKYKEDTLSVTELVRKMKNALHFEVGEVWVEGEVSNLRVQASGHRYFSIKDAGAQLSCVLFRGRSGGAGELIQNGKQVKLFGEITIYEAMGRAQMIVSKVKVAGEGDLQQKFEELKQRLNAEGLFREEEKKPLPPFPQKIALVTSPSGAALQDMLNIFSRRAPWVELYLYGVQVQGKGAEKGISEAVRQLGDPLKYGLPEVDVIIVGRGGGSIEDLWNFNEEVVARAIYECPIPIISAVGHEIDFTIADFVSDYRAPTPSAAAEVSVPDKEGLQNYLSTSQKQLNAALLSRLTRFSERLALLSHSLKMKSPTRIHEERVQYLGDLQERLSRAYESQLQKKATEILRVKGQLALHSPERVLAQMEDRLRVSAHQLSGASREALQQKEALLTRLSEVIRTLGPEATLARGYSITTREDGTVIKSVKEVQPGETISTKLHEGDVQSVVSKG